MGAVALRRFRNKSVFTSYLVAYFGLAVAVCSILGVVLLTGSSSMLRRQERAAVQDRLQNACEDFCHQLDAAQELTLKLRISEHFQPFYLAINRYNDLVMLKELQQYCGFSVLSDQPFLIYEATEDVFTANLNEYSKLSLKMFAQHFLQINSGEDALELFHQSPCFIASPGSGGVFYCRDFYFTFFSQRSRAFLLLPIQSETIASRYDSLFKLNDLSVTAGDVLLHGTDAEPVLSYTMLYNGIPITFAIGTYAEKSLGSIQEMLYMLIGLSVLFSLISIYLAYRQYQPIKWLANKVGMSGADMQNEIQFVAMAMDEVTQKNSDSMVALVDSLEKISRLRDSLRQQVLLLALSGEYDPSLSQRMADAGIDLSGEHFCVVHILQNEQITQAELVAEIHKFTDWETRLYLAHLAGERGWALLISARSDEELLAVYDTLADRLSARFPDIEMHRGAHCSSIQRLAYSLAVAESMQGHDKEDPGKEPDSDLSNLLNLLKEGKREEALDTLDWLFKEIERENSSALFQRYRLLDVVYKLLGAAQKAGVSVDTDNKKISIAYSDPQALRDLASDLVTRLCDAAPKPNEHISPAFQMVMDYIGEHATDADVCLDSVATACDISTKQVSRIVRSVTGMSFKEYVSKQRIRKAMALLRQGLSSTETAEQVGYGDVSYFTKVFRECVGCTPGRYREQFSGIPEDQ